jgi:hypothetical protein
MARLTPYFDRLDPTIPRVKERVPIKIPTIDQLMRPPLPRPWWELLPPPPPSKDPSPYAPVPIIPPPPSPPLEVDPPSRPPEWLFGPPYISRTPAQVPSSGPAYPQFVPPDKFIVSGLAERLAAFNGGLPTTARNPRPSSEVFANGVHPTPYLPLASQQAPRGLPALLEEIGAFDSLNPEAWPSGGLPGLIQEYLRNR